MKLLIKLRGHKYSARGDISALSADIIPKWNYIRTPSADMNKLSDIWLGGMKINLNKIKIYMKGGV